ncbi:hypothetical protein Q3G72_016600 [Acer saccharum]|nr:hypothetical protein Q3G72_016600 [Acer saccharum]
MGDILDVDFSGFEQDLFGDNEGDEGDKEDQVRLGDKSGDDESLGMRALDVVPKVLEEVYDEVSDAKLARVIKSNPFKQLVGCLIRFEVGQTHDSVYTLRSLLTDFTIHEGFNFNKVKNDKNRLTWACMAKGCPWRIHASNVGDDTTMQVKTYKNEHTCHRIYKSKEARSKWIVRKFQVFMKTTYIHLLEKTSTFQRNFVSFEAQRKGFFKGCRPFIGIDGCHLRDPYVGVLLSLRVFLKYLDDKPICFMSDRHKWVIGALKMQWPCASISHALTGIIYHFGVHGDEGNLTGFIDSMLSKSAYLRTYSSMIHPIPDMCVWVDLEIAHVDAPPLKRLPGRPMLVKKRESGEKQKVAKTRTVVCGNCRDRGHKKERQMLVPHSPHRFRLKLKQNPN